MDRRCPSLLPFLAGALAASAAALLLSRPLGAVTTVATVALVVVPLLLVARAAQSDVTPERIVTERLPL